MTEYRSLLERAGTNAPPPDIELERVLRRRDRRRRNQRIEAGLLGLAIAIAVGWLGFGAIRSAPPPPADDQPAELGVFAPVAGRIVYENTGTDQGYGDGLWAIDASGPSDTSEGPRVADDVASTLVPLGLDDGSPIGWSRDGTELLLMRSDHDPLIPEEYLYILHADGSETQLNSEPMYFAEHSAAISPGGERVVFAAQADHVGLFVVDAEGGPPVRIAEEGSWPTFSPDGSQIAYLLSVDNEDQVWVTEADGSDAHEIAVFERGRFGLGVSGLQWSPVGDRLALGMGGHKGSDALAIYTFAPDGSDSTRVITGGISPYWSPDGSQIAYTILCGEDPDASCPRGSILRSQFDAQPSLFGGGSPGLAIADADGSNVREFGFAASGPWHPGTGSGS